MVGSVSAVPASGATGVAFSVYRLIVCVDVFDMRTALWSMFVRISYVTIVGGIVGGVWWIGAVQRSDLRLRRDGLPAPAHQVQAESKLEVSSISNSDSD